jgi:hypothetical protein
MAAVNIHECDIDKGKAGHQEAGGE